MTTTFPLSDAMTLIRSGDHFAAVRDDDPAADGYPYEVIDLDGDVCGSYEAEIEAIDEQMRLEAAAAGEAAEEAREERLSELREMLVDAADGCDSAEALTKALVMLRAAAAA